MRFDPLATSYAFYYEMTLELAAALFLIRDGFGRRFAERAWLLVLWFGPTPAFIFPTLLSVALYTPPIQFVTLAICLARVRGHLSTAGANQPVKTPCSARS